MKILKMTLITLVWVVLSAVMAYGCDKTIRSSGMYFFYSIFAVLFAAAATIYGIMAIVKTAQYFFENDNY